MHFYTHLCIRIEYLNHMQMHPKLANNSLAGSYKGPCTRRIALHCHDSNLSVSS